VIDFTNLFQFGLQFVVVVEPLLNLVFLIWPDTVLLGDAAGIADSQNQNGMAFAASALGTTTFMTNGALKQRTANDLSERGEAAGKFLSGAKGLLAFHY
jgi:hypothetical protein